MKDLYLKIYFFIALLFLSKVTIKCQAATNFTVFPEDVESPGTASIFKDMASDENILNSVLFFNAANGNYVKNYRENLTYQSVNNVRKIFIFFFLLNFLLICYKFLKNFSHQKFNNIKKIDKNLNKSASNQNIWTEETTVKP